jgi:hypothetical protein
MASHLEKQHKQAVPVPIQSPNVAKKNWRQVCEPCRFGLPSENRLEIGEQSEIRV